MVKLSEITIQEYVSLLRDFPSNETVKEIDSMLTEQMSEAGAGIDLSLFMLQKDVLLLQCKMAILTLEFKDEEAGKVARRIEALQKEIDRKLEQKSKISPYESFLDWLLSVEKYLGVSIPENKTLTYLVRATKQMLNFYEAQKQAYENNKTKK